MSLSLTPSQQSAFHDAVRALASPLDHPSDVAWRRAVLPPVKRLVRADKAALVLVGADEPSVSEDYDEDALRRYLSEVEDVADYLQPLPEALPTVFDRKAVWGPNLDAYYRSRYYNDYIRKIRAFNAVGLRVPAGDRSEVDRLGHHLLCHRDRPDPDGFDANTLGLLHLLYPAFEAGVRTWQDWRLRPRLMRTALDRAGLRAMVFTTEGRRRHQTPLLTEALMADPEADRVAAAAADLARSVARLAVEADAPGHRRDGGLPASPTQTVQTAAGRYRLTGSLPPKTLAGPDLLVLVTVDLVQVYPTKTALEEETAALPSAESLRERFAMTRRQAEVARLLARRLTNREVADRLSISPHTARHHTQAVLEALGVPSRRDVRERIAG
jgi:DNA-binding CsgD family transcriptional regulator